MVIFVRHADRAPGGGDVPLSEAGFARAEALREALRAAGVSAIVTTTALRTQQTAEPLAQLLGLDVVAVRWNRVEKTVRDLLPATVLVVGHSDTVPDLVHAFTGETVEAEGFDALFIATDVGGAGHLIRSRYGAPSPDAAR